MDFEIRPIAPDEYHAFGRALETAFSESPHDAEEGEAFRAIFEFDRSVAVLDRGQIVGTAGAFSFDLTVPGPAIVPAAGVTVVGVLPTYRRRGILSAMMRRQLEDVRARGEAIAILMASESVIYGRFGYGAATTQGDLEIDKRYGSLVRPIEIAGRVTLLDRAAAGEVLPGIYDRVRRTHPGAVSRTPTWWDRYYLRDLQAHRNGMSTRFYVAYEAPSGEPQGYVAYRVKHKWEHELPDSTLWIGEMMALTLEARAALWQYCVNIDLISTVTVHNRPIDEPLRWMLTDPRRLRWTQLTDFLWLRLADVAAALSARCYSAEDRLVLEVEDAFCPQNSGRYELIGGADGAECRRSSANTDLALSVADLGAAFLGGVRFDTLVRAGRVAEHTPGAARRADTMFTSDPAPWCAMQF